MPNISKTTRNNIIHVTLFILYTWHSVALATNSCEPYSTKKLPDTLDSICTPGGLILTLNYSPKKRVIWIGSNKDNRQVVIHRLKKNTGPELIGAVNEIKFITRESINSGTKKFVALTFSERSMLGNGAGQCGAGSETYFQSLEIENTRISKIGLFKIQSCLDEVDIAPDDEEHGPSIQLTKNNQIMIRWLAYPKYDNPVTGVYDFKTNNLNIRENASPYHWEAF